MFRALPEAAITVRLDRQGSEGNPDGSAPGEARLYSQHARACCEMRDTSLHTQHSPAWGATRLAWSNA